MPRSKQIIKTDKKVEKVTDSNGSKQKMKGRVVSTKTGKSVTVLLERKKIHPLYKKGFTRSKKLLVHDELGVNLGDIVEIVQTKPISKNKHFKVVRIIGSDIVTVVTEQLKKEASETIAKVLPQEEKNPEDLEDKAKEGAEEVKKVKKDTKEKSKK